MCWGEQGDPSNFLLWDVQAGLERSKTALGVTHESGGVEAIAWSPNSRLLAIGAGSLLMIWDATTIGNGSTKTSQPGELLEWSPDKKYRINWDRSSANRRISIRNAKSTDEVVLETGIADNEVISWEPTGERVAISFENAVGVWDVTTGQRLLSLNGHTDSVWGVRWSPDGKQLASSANDGTVKIWDGVTGKKLKTLFGHDNNHYVSGVTWSPDGEHLTAGGWDRTVRVWNTVSGKELLVLRGHSGGV